MAVSHGSWMWRPGSNICIGLFNVDDLSVDMNIVAFWFLLSKFQLWCCLCLCYWYVVTQQHFSSSCCLIQCGRCWLKLFEWQEEDEAGSVGVTLKKELMSVAGDALKTNITTLGPLVLPWMEQLQFFISLVGRKVFKMNNKPYIPDFKLAFEHFCIHAGGRAVLDEIEKNLKLSEWHMEPSRMTLYR